MKENKSNNPDTFRQSSGEHNNRRKHGRRLATVTSGALLLAASCSVPDNSAKPEAAPQTHIVHDRDIIKPAKNIAEFGVSFAAQQAESAKQLDKIVSEFEAEKAASNEKHDYAVSPERSATLKETLITTGTRLVEIGQSGALGAFDFYNYETGKWSSESEGPNEGWGYYQHNPQYGGSEKQVIVESYQLADGAIDVSKGIKGIRITSYQQGEPSVSLEADDLHQLPYEDGQAFRTTLYYGAETSAPEDKKIQESSDFVSYLEDVSVGDMRLIDATAQAAISRYMLDIEYEVAQ